MIDATHMFAVSTLRNSTKRCLLKVSREVLVVLPDDAPLDEEEFSTSFANGDVPHAHERDDTTPTPGNERDGTPERVISAEVITSDREGEALLLDSDEREEEEEGRPQEGEEEEREINELADMLFGDDEQETKEDEREAGGGDETKVGEDENENTKRDRGDPYVNIHIAQTLRDEALEIESE